MKKRRGEMKGKKKEEVKDGFHSRVTVKTGAMNLSISYLRSVPFPSSKRILRSNYNTVVEVHENDGRRSLANLLRSLLLYSTFLNVISL